MIPAIVHDVSTVVDAASHKLRLVTKYKSSKSLKRRKIYGDRPSVNIENKKCFRNITCV